MKWCHTLAYNQLVREDMIDHVHRNDRPDGLEVLVLYQGEELQVDDRLPDQGVYSDEDPCVRRLSETIATQAISRAFRYHEPVFTTNPRVIEAPQFYNRYLEYGWGDMERIGFDSIHRQSYNTGTAPRQSTNDE